jgi:hypothetical protein
MVFLSRYLPRDQSSLSMVVPRRPVMTILAVTAAATVHFGDHSARKDAMASRLSGVPEGSLNGSL